MERALKRVVAVAYGRSPIAKANKSGAFRATHPVELSGYVLEKVIERSGIDPTYFDDVVLGCSKPEGMQGMNLARLAASRAGCGWTVPGMTINRFCSSGLQAIATAANSIAVGQADIVAAGGTEVMSVMGQAGNPDAFCGWIKENDPGQYSPMWKTAEKVAREYGVTRAQMDEFALQSHKRAALATEKGYFEQQIVPVPGIDREGAQIIVKHDQGIRPDTSFEALSELAPAFDKEHGLVTAGQSSQLSDGSSFVILMSEERAAKMNIEPIAQMVGYAVTGTDPSVMGIGPITAIPKVLRMTGLTLDDIDVIELNEAFAAQAIPCISELGLDPERVNPNGGAIAMGHPTGATGAILTTKALAELARTGGRYAIVSMCVGGGMGVAGVWEMNR